MAIKFNVIQRGQPGVVGGGVKKHYVNVVSRGEMDLETMTQSIEKRSTVGGADIRAVLYALVDVALEELAKGNIVRLGELGSLRVSVSSNGVATPEEVHAGLIKSSKVLFNPGTRIKKMLKTLSFQKTE